MHDCATCEPSPACWRAWAYVIARRSRRRNTRLACAIRDTTLAVLLHAINVRASTSNWAALASSRTCTTCFTTRTVLLGTDTPYPRYSPAHKWDAIPLGPRRPGFLARVS